jgi:hypothetical protein
MIGALMVRIHEDMRLIIDYPYKHRASLSYYELPRMKYSKKYAMPNKMAM